MADNDQQMPGLAAIAGEMNNLSRAHASLATNFERMGNIPAFDAGARILAAIATLTQSVDTRFNLMDARFDRIESRLDRIEARLDRMESRLEAVDFNSVARLMNGHATHQLAPLTPLRDTQNRDVENFPQDWASIDAMTSDRIDELLAIYDLPIVGTVDIRRKQFKRFIGVVRVMTD